MWGPTDCVVLSDNLKSHTYILNELWVIKASISVEFPHVHMEVNKVADSLAKKSEEGDFIYAGPFFLLVFL